MTLTTSKAFYLLVVFALIVCYSADGLNKYLEIYGGEQSVSVFVRFAFQLIFIGLTLFVFNKRTLNLYLALAMLFVCFITGQTILFFFGNIHIDDFLLGFKVFNKYIYAFLLFPVIEHIIIKEPNLFQKLVKLFYLIFIFNILIVLIGLFFDSELIR